MKCQVSFAENVILFENVEVAKLVDRAGVAGGQRLVCYRPQINCWLAGRKACQSRETGGRHGLSGRVTMSERTFFTASHQNLPLFAG